MTTQIKKNYRLIALVGAALTMGMSMPSCPGQQAMQQQLDALQQGNDMNSKRIQAMDTQIRGMGQELGQDKQLMEQMAAAIQTQKGAIDQLNNAVKMLDQKVTAMSTRPKPAAKAPAKKKH
jgi:methyl-accepting chemotaxis protein